MRKEDKFMKIFRTCALLLIVLVSLNIVACGGGTKTDVVTETSTTTLGQELQDLDKAYKDGIITEKEYKKAKEKLIKKKTE